MFRIQILYPTYLHLGIFQIYFFQFFLYYQHTYMLIGIDWNEVSKIGSQNFIR